MSGVVGEQAHQAAVRRLRESYAAIPDGAPVRLAKRTSNLFRPRSQVGTGLDVSALTGVISVDPAARTADVQGMCTYEDLVDVTLAHGMIPLVVPQLRTITLGGAVTGLGIEATSFRSGLPHESVLEMDVLTGGGEVVTAAPAGPAADLFAAFPNSYGSLGYATRVRIELEPVPGYVDLRHVPFTDLDELAAAAERIVAQRSWEGVRVDGLDGVVFEPGEAYLTLATWREEPPPGSPSDYTGQQIYYRSIRQHTTDVLSMHDYLWRWDTDWFWCSRAFGVQHPRVRRLWPRRLRRSDVYHRLGVTLSRNQADWAAAAIEREGLGDTAEVRFGDYRDVVESGFDAVSSIGLTEHIGVRNYPSYFSFIRSRLRPGGRVLNHSITRADNRSRPETGPFIDRYVFPDGELTGSGRIITEMQDAGLEVRHEENLREHYALTLQGWCRNLQDNWAECVAEAGLGTAKVWGLYMAGSRIGFERNEIQLHQVLASRTDGQGRSGFPLRPTWLS